ncbi:hypothetical protein [Tateyamaria sp. syn59]|uniref:hypothetical protein n=1 Tax=Tateyamaria sp. syn59 TaxID=2576942 RepID=UPI0011BFB82B|nr:hypothetical protein [Tateyamaria sp. syn59]
MRRVGVIVTLCAGLAACSSERRPDIPVQDNFPPVGLAASAVWLEERQVPVAQRPRAADIPTSQIRTTVDGRAPAATPVAQTANVPQRARPTTTIALAAQAFGDACVASLPSMSGVLERLRQVSRRDFGVAPSDFGSNFLVTGQRPGSIQLEAAVGVGRAGINQCLISVRKEDPTATATALVATVTGAGYSLREVAAQNADQTWAIAGAPAGTELKINTRRNFLGQQLTGAWITWR